MPNAGYISCFQSCRILPSQMSLVNFHAFSRQEANLSLYQRRMNRKDKKSKHGMNSFQTGPLAMHSYNQIVCKICKSNMKFNVINPHITQALNPTKLGSSLYALIFTRLQEEQTNRLLTGTVTRISPLQSSFQTGWRNAPGQHTLQQADTPYINKSQQYLPNGSWQ